MSVGRALSGTAIATCVLAAGVAASTAEAPFSVLRLDSSGRLAPAASIEAALDHPDGDAVGVILTGPAPAIAGLIQGGPDRIPAGAPATTLLSNGLGAEGDTPTQVVFTPDGSKIVVAHRDSGNLTVFDAATGDVLMSIDLSGSPNAVAITPDGSAAVTANIFEDTASIVDLGAGAESAVVPVGDQPGVVRISPDGLRAVVGNTIDGTLSIIDIAGAVETDVIGPVSFSSSTSINFESGITISSFTDFEFADADTLLMPERFNSQVQVVDITAGTVTPIATLGTPYDLDVSADGLTAVVAHTSGVQFVTVIDVAGRAVSRTIPTGVDLFLGGIAITPDATKAVVGVLNEVRVVDLVGNSISGNISTTGVNGLVMTHDGQHCLVVSFNGALVSMASETVVANLNGQVSTNLGAHSPAGPRGALAGALFTEELLVVSTNGAGGFLEERVPSGPPPEGDKARQAAFAPDGQRLAVTNILSDTLTIVDVPGGQVQGIVDVGDRPSEAEVTPDGTRAVVANLDSTFLSVVDLAAETAGSVGISTRASQVEISPDGMFAYACVVASGDGVWRVNLDTMSVQGPKILTGNMGSIFFLYQQSSGMTLSHDGATLVTCNSFDNNVSIIDTATWTEVLRLPVGTFPVRCVFRPDDQIFYIANRDDDTVSAVFNDGASSFVVGTLTAGDQPFEMAISPDSSRLFVGNFTDATISVFDLPGNAPAGTIVLNERVQDLHVSAASDQLLAAGGNWSVTIGPGPVVTLNQTGELSLIDAATLAIDEQIDTGLPPGNLAFRDAPALAAIPSPHGDGILLANLAPCPGDGNGDGMISTSDLLGLLAAWGTSDPTFDIAPGGGDGIVGTADLLALLAAWGACPM